MEASYRLFDALCTIRTRGLEQRLPFEVFKCGDGQPQASRRGKRDRLIDERDDSVELARIDRVSLLLKTFRSF